MKTLRLSLALIFICAALTGCLKTKSFEGIPYKMLKDKDARESITFYRDYLTSASIATLVDIRRGNKEDAIRREEFILDEIITELFPSIEKFSYWQRREAVLILEKIKTHYKELPRSKSSWSKKLSNDKKTGHEKIDARLEEGIIKLKSDLPEGSLKDYAPMLPILKFRNKMADLSIASIRNIKKGENDRALMRLEKTLNRIVEEESGRLENFSDSPEEARIRKITAGILKKIARYRAEYPITRSEWFLTLPEKRKQYLSDLDHYLAGVDATEDVASWRPFFEADPE